MQARIRNYRDLGVVIREVRTEQGATQEEIAERLGIHRNYLIGMERGLASTSITRLFRALNLLGITVSVSWEQKDTAHHAVR